MERDHDPARARVALGAFGRRDAALTPIETGHINESWHVAVADGAFVLQRLNPIFSAEIHADIAALGEHLRAAGITCARLVPTAAGELYFRDPAGDVWRLQTYIAGVTHEALAEPEPLVSAGRLLGRFHAALWGVTHHFRAPRLGVHDTARHQRLLHAALAAHPQHPAHAEVTALAAAIDAGLARCTLPDALPGRLVHGDPKLANIVFSPAGEALALIDLDTLGRMAITLELGDALRSWCNLAAEADVAARFSLPHLAASLAGYAEGIDGRLEADEVAQLPDAVGIITLELAARFGRDALEERYFSLSPPFSPLSPSHHLVRARGQLALANSYAGQLAAVRAEVARLF